MHPRLTGVRLSRPEEQPELRSRWLVAAQSGAALAAAMGVGRFVFTPILPLMEAQAGLTREGASLLATGNYLGYLVGAIGGIALPVLSRARLALRVSGVVLVVTLLLMPLTHDLAAWVAVRAVAGAASAVVFMVAGSTILTELTSAKPHLVGWAYGGVGAGIAASGILIAVVRATGERADWQAAWWSAAVLTVALLAAGWPVGAGGRRGEEGQRAEEAGRAATPEATGQAATSRREATGRAAAAGRGHRAWFGLLTASYFLEGAGYIIAGTFLVAAVSATGPGWLGGSVWTIVGLAALPSCALWTWLSARVSRPSLITGALVLQAVGIALPALSGGAAAAIASAALFGGTFVGVTTLSLATGRHLGVPRAIAILTAGYGIGQVAGPLVVTPLLSGGYRTALLVGAAIALAAAIASALLRVRFPHDGQPHGRLRPHGRLMGRTG
jgi:MFS family permease